MRFITSWKTFLWNVLQFVVRNKVNHSTLFALLILPAFLMIGIQPVLYSQNIKGVAPLQDPNGGLAIDGNAYIGLPGDNPDAGDWLFPFGFETPDPLAEDPGAVFPPEASDAIATGIPDQPIPDEFYNYPGQTTFFRDNITNNDPTIFIGSNKINHDPNTYEWGTGSSPNKNEIQNAIAHFSFADPTLQYGNAGDLWLAFAADRQVTNGSSYIDFEVLQAPLFLNPNGTVTSLGPHKGRTLGDILVTIEFTQGGGAAKVVTRRWVASGTSYIYQVFTPDPGTVFGTENDVMTIVPFSIYFQDPIVIDVDGDGVNDEGFYQYKINQWAEGAVNISSFFPDDPCVDLSTLFVRTRTSGSSAQSELKDFPGRPIQITIDLTPPAPELTDVEDCDSWEGTLSATGCDGTVKWYNAAEGGDLLHTGADFDPGVISETTSFWASCTVQDCEGPRAMVTVTIYDSPTIEIDATDVTCSGFNDGVVSITSASNYDLLELFRVNTAGDDILVDSNTDGSDFTGLSEGSYYVVASSENGENDFECSTTSNTVEIEDPLLLELELTDVTDVSCNGFEDGAIDITASGGTGAYTFDWDDLEGSNDPEDRSGIGAGTYSVTVTDERGCTASLNNILVGEPDELTGEVISTTNPTCFGFTDGSIDINVTGGTPPYTYDWADLDGTNNPEDRENIGDGSYSVTVTDANDCVYQFDQITLNEPTELLVELVPTDETCELNDGTITVNASGGTPPYEYSLDDLTYDVSNIFTGLAAGDYTVYTKDANDCISQDPVSIAPPENCVEEGCTLGYWKEHTNRWCDSYATCDLYGEVFENAPDSFKNDGLTLQEALNLGGGGIYNLARQSVAALLNTCSSEVSFEYSNIQDLIDDVNTAFANGTAGSFATYLDGLNQTGCPLGGTSATTAPSPGCGAEATSLAVNGFSVSPVPVVDELSVQYHFKYVSNVNIQVFNLSGQMIQKFVFKGVTAGDVSTFNVGSLVKPGQAYILKVNTDRESFSKTILSSD